MIYAKINHAVPIHVFSSKLLQKKFYLFKVTFLPLDVNFFEGEILNVILLISIIYDFRVNV